ncbi:MAG: ATP-dependent metalloprotease FtsH [Thermoleophilia bacterium]|nr:ATP-dependent metalloprotease FtsH [Thermoleophilia bacterium]
MRLKAARAAADAPGMDAILATFAHALRDFLAGVPSFLSAWAPVLMLFLFGALIWVTVRMIPRSQTKVETPDSNSKVTWADVAGVDEFRKELEEVVEFMRDPQRFKKLGAKVPKGVMLYGPPGTGKTLLAKAVAGESGAMFYAQSASGFVEMFAGLGAARIRKLFDEARKNAPAIIFIDELDAIGGARGGGGGDGGSREKDQTLNQLLVEMDGFSSGEQIVIIGATNRLDTLDPALLRAGRFDRQLYVGPPDVKGRLEILQVHTKDKPLAEDLDLEMVARRTPGATGADLANICNEAAIYAGRAGREEIIQKDFQNAFDRVVAGIAQAKVMTVEERETVAYHEAGHAILSTFVDPPRAVHRVTIVPTGQALGYVLHVPEEDKYTESREELINQMIIALGGRAAEELVYGRIWNGAASDLEAVTRISRAMVFDWGMGKTVNSLALKANNYSLSERTKELRDKEQLELAEHAFAQARSMLAERRDQLETLAQVLLEKETLDQREVEEILGVEHKSPGPLVPEKRTTVLAAYDTSAGEETPAAPTEDVEGE